MVLDTVFSPDLILTDLESTDKEEVFEELVDLYVSRYPSASRSGILSSIRAREGKLTTGIKPGIAVPHAQTEAVDSVRGVLGISREGIDYDSLDGKPVHLVFLLLSSGEGCSLHLRVLKRLSVLFDDPSFSGALLEKKNPAGVYDILCKYEGILVSMG